MPNLDTTTSIQVFTSAKTMRAAVLDAQRAGETVGFVPTMGALHEGHLSLVEASQAACDRTVVSIFVNPTQFGPNEDLANYPRDLDNDLRQLEKIGCWAVFAPPTEEMYPEGTETQVEVGSVAEPLEGAARPGHFQGVATIVLKLFQIVPADQAFFGQKDYQQTLVVGQMIRDLSVPISLTICPTVREPDGLAMSSRNAYLSATQRQQALTLRQSLLLAEKMHAEGNCDVAQITERMNKLFDVQSEIEVDYIAFVEAGTVQPVTTITGPTVIAAVVRLGQTRLLDNHQIG